MKEYAIAHILFWLGILFVVLAIASGQAEELREVDVHPDSALNVRLGADVEYKVIGKLAGGAKVLVLETHKDWALVA